MNELIPRIGSVPYLNARPLLEGLEYPITELVPAQLYEEFQKGRLDAALLSSIDVLSQSDAIVVDGAAIASRGAVYSVILAYKGELDSLELIQLDTASHTSNALLQVILSEFYGLQPEYVQFTASLTTFLPRLLIGDPAIEFRKNNTDSEIHILDLGADWYYHTGFPFVFALWILKSYFTEKKLVADALRYAKSLGLSHLSEIATRTHDAAFALHYLRDCISYNLNDGEKQGLKHFQELLHKYQLIAPGERKLTFI